jgi:hypothetical protein
MICKRNYCGDIEKIGYCTLTNSICYLKCDWNKGIDEEDKKQIEALLLWKKELKKAIDKKKNV